jgi:hypothetical protein
MKLETSISTFAVGDIHPDARVALRDFATDVLKDTRTIYTMAGTA